MPETMRRDFEPQMERLDDLVQNELVMMGFDLNDGLTKTLRETAYPLIVQRINNPSISGMESPVSPQETEGVRAIIREVLAEVAGSRGA